MARRPAQPDLLAWTPPAPVARFDDNQVRAATMAARISKAVAASLKDCSLPRDEIAKRMSDFLGERISRAGLDALASQARDDHRISVTRLMALVHVTRDMRLLQLLAEPFGWAVVEARYLPLIEVAAIREQEDELRRRRTALTARARGEGALEPHA